MIVDLPGTTVSGISKRLVLLRREGGATTLGRVLTLVIVAPSDQIEDAISAANVASREHPMRIIALAEPTEHAAAADVEPRLDGQIRVGADAGAGDVIVLRPHGAAGRNADQLLSGLLLADAPVVVWWAGDAPSRASETSLGRLAQRRIVDSGGVGDAPARLRATSASYRPGDTDLAWSRLTLWRAQLAAALDNVPSGSDPRSRIIGATVRGTLRSSSTLLLAAWLRLQLGVPVDQQEMPEQGPDEDRRAWGIHSVEIHTAAGDISIARTRGVFAAITQPGHPLLEVPLPRRSVSECLIEDLRLLRPDTLYGRVITEGLPLLDSEFEEER